MLRRDNQKIYVQAIIHLAIGQPALLFLELLGQGNVTIRNTSTAVQMHEVQL
jgi:hypothetical protein